jgi:hypothetical protein
LDNRNTELELLTSSTIEQTICFSAVLRLTLKKSWFDMIKTGEKKEEYRELKDYWCQRLIPDFSHIHKFDKKLTSFKQYDFVEFKNGYSKNAPKIILECKGIKIGKPKLEWCIDTIGFDKDDGAYDDCFIIELGKILS